MIDFLDHAAAPRPARSLALDLEARELPRRCAQAAALATGGFQPHPRAGKRARRLPARSLRPTPAHYGGGIGSPSPCRADDRAGRELPCAFRRARPVSQIHPYGGGGFICPHLPFAPAAAPRRSA